MRNWVVLSLCLALMVLAQTLWKTGLERIGVIDVSAPWWPQVTRLLRAWRILAGISIFGVTTLLWFDLLSRMPLSQLYPLMSGVYVIAFFVGWAFLGEKPDLLRFVGIAVICVGIVLVARSGS